MTRAVVDTNVVVSAQISPSGAPACILHLWRETRFVLVVSEPMLAEIGRMLAHPRLHRYGLTAADATSFVQAIRELGDVTPGCLSVSGTARDPMDDMVLAAAAEGAADYIVSGDQDLLSIGAYEGIPIIPPAGFLRFLGGG